MTRTRMFLEYPVFLIKMSVIFPLYVQVKIIQVLNLLRFDSRIYGACADPDFSEGVGGGGVQISRRGLTENFNMAKINNLAIPGGGGGGSGPPVPPLDPPMWRIKIRKVRHKYVVHTGTYVAHTPRYVAHTLHVPWCYVFMCEFRNS